MSARVFIVSLRIVIVSGLDFAALTGMPPDFSGLADLRMSMSLMVKPDVLNLMLIPVEFAVKLLLSPILLAALILIMITTIVIYLTLTTITIIYLILIISFSF